MSDTDTELVKKWIASKQALNMIQKLARPTIRDTTDFKAIREREEEERLGAIRPPFDYEAHLQERRDRQINKVLANVAMSAAELGAKAIINQIQTGRTGWIHELWDAAQSRPKASRGHPKTYSMMDAPAPPLTREGRLQLQADKAWAWRFHGQGKDMR